MDAYLLSLLIWVPVLGGIAVLLLGSGDTTENPRAGWGAPLSLLVSLLTLALCVPLATGFDSGSSAMQFVERTPWIGAFHVYYFLGVDGLSVPLILLTAFVTPLVIIAGWDASSSAAPRNTSVPS